jgi:hypothetical protein
MTGGGWRACGRAAGQTGRGGGRVSGALPVSKPFRRGRVPGDHGRDGTRAASATSPGNHGCDGTGSGPRKTCPGNHGRDGTGSGPRKACSRSHGCIDTGAVFLSCPARATYP